jgi:hypothetical protein
MLLRLLHHSSDDQWALGRYSVKVRSTLELFNLLNKPPRKLLSNNTLHVKPICADASLSQAVELGKHSPLNSKSRSASSNTAIGTFPPNTRLTFFAVPAANFANALPTPVDSVKLTFLINGLTSNSEATPRSFLTTSWITFLGNPASMASLAKENAIQGVSEGGLTTAHSAANIGAILVIIVAGKLQGVIISHTPTGSLGVMTTVSGAEDVITRYRRLHPFSANKGRVLNEQAGIV